MAHSKDHSRALNALDRIRSCFSQHTQKDQIEYLDALILRGQSSDALQELEFRSGLKNDKYLWGGMGTLADTVIQDRAKDASFRDAYIDLAEACKELNLESVYSSSVLKTFSSWKKKGL
jgi:hypothetical protein